MPGNDKLMNATGQSAYVVCISNAPKNNITLPLTWILDREAGPNKLLRALQPALWLPDMIKSDTSPHFSASKSLLKDQVQTKLYLWLANSHTANRLQVSERMAINVLLDTTFIEEHILTTVSEYREITVWNESTVSALELESMLTNGVQN